MIQRTIPFSPPDITQAEIDEVVDTLKSGWITTGPKTKLFEKELADYCGVERAVCLSSATAGLELILRMLEIGPGDEVITTPYTFAATANVILHCGAKPVFVDLKEGEFNISPENIEKAITSKTKAVIPVDFGGWPCDYDEINQVLINKRKKFHPKKNTLQAHFNRPVLIVDAAHSFGSVYNEKRIGNAADFTVFSFHAVKNLTTAEGGAAAFNSFTGLTSDEIYGRLQLLSLHGQSKDALSKMNAGSWRYSIELPGYKYNMTDITAAIGLAQLRRYENEIIPRRKTIYEIYKKAFKDEAGCILPPFEGKNKRGNYHLFPLRIKNINEEKRSEIIRIMAEIGIALNVHFIPVVMHPAYTKLGYHIKDYPNTLKMYENEISLPLYSKLSEEDADYLCIELKKVLSKLKP